MINISNSYEVPNIITTIYNERTISPEYAEVEVDSVTNCFKLGVFIFLTYTEGFFLLLVVHTP